MSLLIHSNGPKIQRKEASKYFKIKALLRNELLSTEILRLSWVMTLYRGVLRQCAGELPGSQ